MRARRSMSASVIQDQSALAPCFGHGQQQAQLSEMRVWKRSGAILNSGLVGHPCRRRSWSGMRSEMRLLAGHDWRNTTTFLKCAVLPTVIPLTGFTLVNRRWSDPHHKSTHPGRPTNPCPPSMDITVVDDCNVWAPPVHLDAQLLNCRGGQPSQ